MVGRVLREPPDSLLPFEAVVDPWEGMSLLLIG